MSPLLPACSRMNGTVQSSGESKGPAGHEDLVEFLESSDGRQASIPFRE
jgi:hypothetical protein